MRKHLLWLSVVLVFAGGSVLQAHRKKMGDAEQPVKKNISFAVCFDRNYSAAAYENALAQPRIIINKLRAGSKIVVWDKTYDFKQLRDYSSLKDGILENVVINNLMESKEELEVTYILTYNTKGSVLKMCNDTIFTASTQRGQVYINL